MSRLADFLKESYCMHLSAHTKDEALHRMVDILMQADEIKRIEQVIRAEIFEREKILSTGIGQGIAVPHIRVDGLEDIHIAFGLFKKPIEFGSIDNTPVQIIVMVVVPKKAHTLYLKILASIVTLFKDESVRNRVLQAPDCQAAYALLKEY